MQAGIMVLLAGVAMGYSTGPDPRYTGAPGDAPEACTACHTGTLNSGGGSVRVVFPGGTQYTPGATYRIKVELRDPNMRRWGFQLTARLGSDLSKGQAGDLIPADDNTQTICEDGGSKPCGAGQVQFIQHQLGGTRNGTRTGADFEFDWKAPADGAGQVVFYVAGNAANGNAQNTGDAIYTSSVTVDVVASNGGGGGAVTVPPTAYEVKMLVGDIAGLADRVDPNLKNPVGLSMSASSPFWVSNAGSGTSTLYNTAGELFPADSPLIVKIPAGQGQSGQSKPTGQVWNGTTAFEVAAGKAATFLFSTENGTIAGWNRDADATSALTVVDNSGPGAVYRGLALGLGVNGPMLYAANFGARKVDVFDSAFQPVTSSGGFRDPNLPEGYAPFNVQRFGKRLYVAFARQNEAKKQAVAGEGNGIVSVFDLDGNFKLRLVSNGVLNAPWGMAMAPSFFGDFSNTLLVGNFGDGRIHAFDIGSGELIGTLSLKDGSPAVIEGLWGLAIGNGRTGGEANTLYFTAGVSGGGAKEEHGVFGSISVAQ